MRNIRNTRHALASLCAAALVACGGDGAPINGIPPVHEAPPAGNTLPPELIAAITPPGTAEGTAVEALIGPAGGTLATNDGRIAVDVPPGAFDVERLVRIQPITNTAHGGPGAAYRITPEGLRTPLPMKIRWHWSDEDIAGSAPGLLAAGYRDARGLWRLMPTVLDRDARTLTVSTHHFSDWSMLPGAALTPAMSTVRSGENADLRVAICKAATNVLDESDIPMPGEMNSVRLPCKYDAATLAGATIQNWAVNGITAGNSSIGWMSDVSKGVSRYTAPSVAPNGLLAVSVEVLGAEPVERQLLAASIKVLPSQVPVPPTSCDSYDSPHTTSWSAEVTIDYAYSDSAAYDEGIAYLTMSHQANLHATLYPVDEKHFKGAFDSGTRSANTDEQVVYPNRPSQTRTNRHLTGVPEAPGSVFNLVLTDCGYMIGVEIDGIGTIRSGRYPLPVDIPWAVQQATADLPGRSYDWGDLHGDPAFFPGSPFNGPRSSAPYVGLMDTAGVARVTWKLTPIH